jgi:UDP-3-O-[3-hydroxymyristoyl] glucosamine N-acyltransferase
MDAQTLAKHIGGTLEGANLEVTQLAPPENPAPGTAIVVSDDKQLAFLEDQTLAVVILSEKSKQSTKHPVIRVKEPRLALAQLTQLFDTRPLVAEGIHPSAVIHPSATLAEGVHVAENAVVRANASIGKGSRIGAGCVISDNVGVGEDCILHPNVTLYANVTLGERVIVHSGAVIGSDGFGYAPSPQGAAKIHHLGSVQLGNDVEIGANTCIDRGTLSDTVIGARTKIDNLCQIGHNIKFGTDCLVAGRTSIAGSVTVGNRVTIGGSVGIADHLMIGDGARLAAGSGITKHVPAGETWAGFPAQPYRKWVRGLYLQGQLEAMWKIVKGMKRE